VAGTVGHRLAVRSAPTERGYNAGAPFGGSVAKVIDLGETQRARVLDGGAAEA